MKIAVILIFLSFVERICEIHCPIKSTQNQNKPLAFCGVSCGRNRLALHPQSRELRGRRPVTAFSEKYGPDTRPSFCAWLQPDNSTTECRRSLADTDSRAGIDISRA
jgi:hypothetical protein